MELVQAGGGTAARDALAQLVGGIADMGSGTASTWPYGAILPSVTSRSQWHPWAAQMPAALADAATALHQPGLLTATGPDNLWGPAPADSSQIAYGAGEPQLRPADHRGRGGQADRAGRGHDRQPGQYRRIAVERRRLRPAGDGLTASTLGGTGQLDALLLTPLIAVLITTGHDTASPC